MHKSYGRTALVRFIFSCFALAPALVFGQESTSKSKPLSIPATADFEIAGDGSATAWNLAPWTPLSARDGARARYQTNIKLLYSGTGIYCLFYCQDNQITATLKEDFADLFKEDVVEIFFWPDQTIPVYFEYELSPYNYELPILVPNRSGSFFGWRPWHYEGNRVTRRNTRVNRDEKGVTSWTAEFFIPFALLKPLILAAPVKGDVWRANMYRIDYDEGATHWSWKVTRKNFHDYESYGAISFD